MTYTHMRILIFLLLANVSFGQISSRRSKPIFPGPIDSLILGEWELKETITSAMYEHDTVSKIQVTETNGPRVKITVDSLVVRHNERFYKRNEGYNYVLDGNLMKLYLGKKKKRKQVDSLTIELADFQEIVLSSEEYISSPLGGKSVKVSFRYQRVNSDYVDSIRKRLKGTWRMASNEPIVFIGDTASTILHLFKNKEMSDSLQNHLKLEFFSKNVGIGMSYSFSVWSHYQTHFDGAFSSETSVFIDYQRQLLYFPGKETAVYHFSFTESNELVLTFVKTFVSHE